MLQTASCTPHFIAAELVAPAHSSNSGTFRGLFSWPVFDTDLGGGMRKKDCGNKFPSSPAAT